MGRRRDGERWMTFWYDRATHTGTLGTKTLTARDGSAQKLPDNAIVLERTIEPLTTPTSAGAATIALGCADAGLGVAALCAATAFDDDVWKTTVQADVDRGARPNAKVDESGGSAVTATIADAALTAGAFLVHVRYRLGA